MAREEEETPKDWDFWEAGKREHKHFNEGVEMVPVAADKPHHIYWVKCPLV